MKHSHAFLPLIVFICIIHNISCSTEKTAEEITRRVLLKPAQNTDSVVRILLYYDMEGISGQNSIWSIDFGRKEYFQAREWLTNDVNAVIDGLFAGGADSIDVVDAHGSFNPEPDILLDKMDSRAKMLYKDKPFDPYLDLVEEGKYDAVVAVCMHSKTGGGGFASHTLQLGMDWILNDMSINESEILAYSWGRANVPLIFVSGDDKLEKQLSWMTWLEYVIVKKAKGFDDAELRPFQEVHEELRAAAKRAIQKISESYAVGLTEPIKAQLRVVQPGDLSILRNVPGIDYQDHTVTFEAANFKEAYDGIRSLMGIAQFGYFQILYNVVLQQENGSEIFNSFKEEIFSVWNDIESGKRKPPMPPEKKEKDSTKKYFGSK